MNMPGKGMHNVVYVATEHDSVYAFDADGQSTSPLWRVSFWFQSAGRCDLNSSPAMYIRIPAYVSIAPEVRHYLHPTVIDPASHTLYVEAATKEHGSTLSSASMALDIASGAERSGSPVVIQASVPGTGYDAVDGRESFDPRRELQRPGLLLLNGVVYIGFGSHDDIDPFHGWILSATTRARYSRPTHSTPHRTPRKQASGRAVAGCRRTHMETSTS